MRPSIYDYFYVRSPITKIALGILGILISIVFLLFQLLFEEPRMEAQAASWEGRSIEKGAVLFANNCANCHGVDGKGLPNVGPALHSKYFFTERKDEVGWSGPLKDYVELTVAAGRPSKINSQWPQKMPTWSRLFGGPLRDDQVESVVMYVLNWESSALEQSDEDDLWQPFITPGTDAVSDGPRTSPELYLSMGCQGCHKLDQDQTPDNEGQPGPHQGNLHETAATRVEGLSAEEYVYQSIVDPNSYVVEGNYVANVMPQNFSDQMSEEEINSLVAWILDPNRSYDEEPVAEETATEETSTEESNGEASDEAAESTEGEEDAPGNEDAVEEVGEESSTDGTESDTNSDGAEEAADEEVVAEGDETPSEDAAVDTEEAATEEAGAVDTEEAIVAEEAEVNRISILMQDLYFGETNDNLQNPPVWTMMSGQNYEVEFQNQSPAVQHSWAVAKKDREISIPYNPETDVDSMLFISAIIEPSTNSTISFTAPEEAGDYFVVCTVPGHSAIMQGKLVVE